MAGVFVSTDANTQVVCQDDSSPATSGARCPGTPAQFQYVEHSLRGTRNGTKGGVTFEFDWTPDDDLTGDLTFYIAANAANGDGDRTGDHIYYRTYTLKQISANPAINPGGVVNGASFTSDVAANTWVTITGTNLSATTRAWNGSDFVNGLPPAQLDGVSVAFDGKPAYVEYVSPTQVNVLAPTDAAAGAVNVVLTLNGTPSAPAAVSLAKAAPEVFVMLAKYAAAEHADGTFVTPDSPAKPGEVVVLFVNGLGPAPANTTVAVGGANASVSYAGPVSGAFGLEQINIQVPDSIADGDAAVVLQVDGIGSAGTVFLPVKR